MRCVPIPSRRCGKNEITGGPRQGLDASGNGYDVGLNDQRFAMIRNRGGEEASELIVVENFFEELTAKAGN